MQKLSKNILALLSESTASPKIRPTLQYIYYLPEYKILVSTDVFRLHEVSIDLGNEPLYFDTKGNEIQPSQAGKFPSYQSFFYDTTIQKYPCQLYLETLKDMVYYTKHINHSTIWNPKEQTMKTYPSYHLKDDVKTFDIKMKSNNIFAGFEHDIGINIDYLCQAIRYITPFSKHITQVSIQQKESLSPLVIHGTCDGHDARILIMPLKIS